MPVPIGIRPLRSSACLAKSLAALLHGVKPAVVMPQATIPIVPQATFIFSLMRAKVRPTAKAPILVAVDRVSSTAPLTVYTLVRRSPSLFGMV